MQRTVRVLAVTALGALALSACGSSKSTSTATSTPTDSQASAGSSSATPTASASSATPTDGSTVSASPISHNVPDVTSNATDLTKEPVLAAGKGDPDATLATKDLVVGTGKEAVITDTVTVKYLGAIWKTGKVFDKSWGRDSGYGMDAYQFPLNGVVPGFAQGIVGMKEGGRRVIAIPPALGYGPAGGQPGAGIGADDTIVFVVDLVKVG